jgi:hypothetical protein
MADDPNPTASGGTERPRPRTTNRATPNYAARRMLITTAAITAIVAAMVVGWRVIRNDDAGSVGAARDWDRIAFVDRTTGEVTLLDGEGSTAGTVVGSGRVDEVLTWDRRIALVGTDRIVLLDVDEGAEPTIVPFARGDSVTPMTTDEGLFFAIGSPTGGDLVIVDGATGDTIDVGALAQQDAPLMFAATVRWAADGSAFAVADAVNFQTLLVRPGAAAPAYFPDQPVAVGDDLIATSQVVGREADLTLFDMERRSQATGTIEIPASGLIVGDSLLVVSIDGSVFRLDRGDQQAERLGSISIPSNATVRWALPSLDGSRLVVVGSVFEAVIDLDGRTKFVTTFTAPVEAAPPVPDWQCLPVGGPGNYHSLIALESGDQLADLVGFELTGTASDGCTVIGERDGVTEVVTTDGSVRLGNLRRATLGPDGRTVVTETVAGRVELVHIADDLTVGDPIDLSGAAPSNLAVAFIGR